MSYATLAEMLAEYDRPENPELSQLLPDGAGGADTAPLGQALTDAAGLMDDYIGVRYRLPLSGLTAQRAGWLRRVNLEIARFLVWKDHASDEVRQRYEDHLRYLRELANGTIRWPEMETPQTGAVGSPQHAAPDPIFDRSTLADY